MPGINENEIYRFVIMSNHGQDGGYSGPRFSDSDLRWKPVRKRGL